MKTNSINKIFVFFPVFVYINKHTHKYNLNVTAVNFSSTCHNKNFFVIFKQKCVENEVWKLIFINNPYIEKSECK